MRTQTHVHWHTGNLPETDNSLEWASSVAYFPNSYPFSASSIADTTPLERYIKQASDNDDWLSAGILHDFNNLLAIILSHSSIALTKLPSDHPAHRYVERAVRATKRAADLSSQLVVNMAHNWVEPMPVDLNQVVQDIVELLDPRLINKIEIQLQLNPNTDSIMANVTQIQQIVMNLLFNAAQAIEQEPGRITIVTDNFCVPAGRQPALVNSLPAGNYVYLQITDTGVGMDQSLINRIFEPQFTTKPTGNGIGLTATLAIIQAHKGAVRVFSTPGRGTTFQVFLPLGGNHNDFASDELDR